MERQKCIICHGNVETGSLGYICNACRDRFRGKTPQKVRRE